MRSLVVVVALSLSFVACGAEQGDPAVDQTGLVLCTLETFSGLSVEIRDAVSGAPGACGATGTLEEGAYVEALTDATQCIRNPDSPYLWGAFGRAGTYRVTVSKPGYQTWVQEQVVIASDGCHLIPVALQANLEPL